jgi:micrococcal nuclease
MREEYIRNAICYNVVDGDTIDINTDLGYHIWYKQRVRLNGLDTPETRTKNLLEKEAGLKVEQYIKSLILDQEITIKSIKDDKAKFGNYLVEIYLEDGTHLNQHLLDIGFARLYEGEKKEIWSESVLTGIINTEV